jgi:DNA-binding beta-propeller fold protein YncE
MTFSYGILRLAADPGSLRDLRTLGRAAPSHLTVDTRCRVVQMVPSYLEVVLADAIQVPLIAMVRQGGNELKCAHCGGDLEPEDRFCGECGRPAKVPASSVNGEAGQTRVGEIWRFEGHTDEVYSVAFYPNGRYVLSGSMDHTIRLWDIESGREVRCFRGHTQGVESVVFSSDGYRALSGSCDDTVRLWDIETERELRRIIVPSGARSIAISPNGHRVLSGGFDGTVRLWDIETGKELLQFEVCDGIPADCVVFSPDGRSCVVAQCYDPPSISLWDLESGRNVRSFGDPGFSVAFSPDGRWVLAASFGDGGSLWDPNTGRKIGSFGDHPGLIYCVAFSPDGRRALSCSGTDDLLEEYRKDLERDNTVRLLDVESGTEIHCFEGHTRSVLSAAFSPNGLQIVSGSSDKTVRLWQLPSS